MTTHFVQLTIKIFVCVYLLYWFIVHIVLVWFTKKEKKRKIKAMRIYDRHKTYVIKSTCLVMTNYICIYLHTHRQQMYKQNTREEMEYFTGF